MAKRLTYEEKKNQAVIYLINEMFKHAGHTVTFDDIKDRKDAWYSEWTMTESQYDAWKADGVKYLTKTLKVTKRRADKEMAWFALLYGLSIKTNNNGTIAHSN